MHKISIGVALCLLVHYAQGQATVRVVNVAEPDSAGIVVISYELGQNDEQTDTVRLMIIRQKKADRLLNPTVTGGTVNLPVTHQKQPINRKLYWDAVKDLNRSKEQQVRVMVYINQPPQWREVQKAIFEKRERKGIFEKRHTRWVALGASVLSGLAAAYIRTNFTSQRSTLNAYRDGFYTAQTGLITDSQNQAWQTQYQQVTAARKPTLFNALIGTSVAFGVTDVIAFWRWRKPKR